MIIELRAVIVDHRPDPVIEVPVYSQGKPISITGIGVGISVAFQEEIIVDGEGFISGQKLDGSPGPFLGIKALLGGIILYVPSLKG